MRISYSASRRFLVCGRRFNGKRVSVEVTTSLVAPATLNTEISYHVKKERKKKVNGVGSRRSSKLHSGMYMEEGRGREYFMEIRSPRADIAEFTNELCKENQ
jgi:hypothetical protein